MQSGRFCAIVDFMREYIWHGYTVKITKKKIRNTNLRIKPDDPQVIHVSVPYSVSYDAARQMLEQPRIVRWVENYQKKLREQPVPPKMQNEEKLKQEPCYRKHLNDVLPAMFRKWESVLGVRSNKVTIRDTRSQWGSCNPRNGNISISVWLGAFPEECIEYVVVHELTHLLEPGHNERFYGILEHYYPSWRTCREQLRGGL